MRIRLIAVGSKMPNWIEIGFQEYSRRLQSDLNLELIEIALNKRTKGCNLKQLQEKEAKQMLMAITPQDLVIALEISGKNWSTEELSSQLHNWMNSSINVSLLIGGPEGLHISCLKKANLQWSLSPLTFPHPLVRVLLAEQLYRAMSIIKNHPYHK